MFSKKLKKHAAPNGSGEIGMLGTDTLFKGNLKFKGTLRIDGQVEGAIRAVEGNGAVLVINQDAKITGNIIADTVLISGEVLGNIKALHRVEIYSQGRLKGDVLAGDVMIEGGAEFEGNCTMVGKMTSEEIKKMEAQMFS